MRILIATVLSLASVIAAGAETKIFVIENHRDDYGVDQCLASGARCGRAAASAYCEARKYAEAASFRRVDPDELTTSSGIEISCRAGLCSEYVAIECRR
jgi:hypothetical protein